MFLIQPGPQVSTLGLREVASPLGLLSALGVVFVSVCICPHVRCSFSELGAVCLVCSRVRPQWGLAGESLGAKEEAGLLPVSHGHLDGEETTALFLGFANSHSSSSLLPGNSLLSWQHQC